MEFLFSDDEYDIVDVLYTLYDTNAPTRIINRALDIMNSGKLNTGFTYTNPEERLAVVVIGPTSSGKEFINTLVHEIHHVAVAIADSLGIDLESETPAYIAGDSVRDLADLICFLGCDKCRKQ